MFIIIILSLQNVTINQFAYAKRYDSIGIIYTMQNITRYVILSTSEKPIIVQVQYKNVLYCIGTTLFQLWN